MPQRKVRMISDAIEDFRRARWQATLQQAYARMTGRSVELIPYEEARRALRATTQIERGLQEIPLDAIVGSVGRYSDFTRSFLPRSDAMQERWANVQKAATQGGGWPPIVVYKLGDAYFVLDGNHRVSVARQMGMKTIQAYVTEVLSKVPLTPDATPDEIICKARYAEFLERTNLDQIRPGANLMLTAPGGYRILDEHIAVHRHYLGLEQQREISPAEALASWYDNVYMPVARLIRQRGILQDFPGRTEADLYIWLSEHRAELEELLGWRVSPEAAVDDLVSTQSPKNVLSRVSKRLIDSVIPEEWQPRPEPREWRKERLVQRYLENLFHTILVPLNGQEEGWVGQEQALIVAQREGDSELRGLHVVSDEADKESEAVRQMQARFVWRSHELGIPGSLIAESGQVAHVITDRARWNDLVVLALRYPPGKSVLERLSSGFRQVVQRCPRPVLAVPQRVSPLSRALLAYDGNAKSEEALFMAAYVAERWRMPLTVVMAYEKQAAYEQMAEHVRRYLELHELTADWVAEKEDAATLILQTAVSHACDLIIMGGYGSQPVLDAVLGNTADAVLRETAVPVLICQ